LEASSVHSTIDRNSTADVIVAIAVWAGTMHLAATALSHAGPVLYLSTHKDVSDTTGHLK